jgi:thiamine biosynthesis protein ThiS
MTLTINGEEREFTGVATLLELIGQLGMKPDRVAVELNRELISRDRWAATQLSTGDKLEIVHFVGGGSDHSVGGPNFASFSVLAM